MKSIIVKFIRHSPSWNLNGDQKEFCSTRATPRDVEVKYETEMAKITDHLGNQYHYPMRDVLAVEVKPG